MVFETFITARWKWILWQHSPSKIKSYMENAFLSCSSILSPCMQECLCGLQAVVQNRHSWPVLPNPSFIIMIILQGHIITFDRCKFLCVCVWMAKQLCYLLVDYWWWIGNFCQNLAGLSIERETSIHEEVFSFCLNFRKGEEKRQCVENRWQFSWLQCVMGRLYWESNLIIMLGCFEEDLIKNLLRATMNVTTVDNDIISSFFSLSPDGF